MEGRRGEKEREEECIASSDTNQMSSSPEEDTRTISKWLNELKQTVADDARTAKATKTYQRAEDIIQRATQMQNKMQNKLTKEEGKSARLQSAKGRHPEYSNVRKRNEKLPTSAAHHIQRTKEICSLCTKQQ